MTRIIKFRAFDKEKNKMYKPIHEAFKGNLFELMVGFGGDLFAHTMDGVNHESMFPDRFALMQFTGLTDKNEKDIYCSDLVKGYFNKNEVEDWIYLGLTDEELKQGWKIFEIPDNVVDFARLLLPDCLEVIGNIYQSLELLK